MSEDPYALSAEFYDVLSERQWHARKQPIAAALRQAPTGDGPVLDVGAGTGPCVRVIADAVAGVPIFAVEPSAAMRAGLACRIMQDPDLRTRVTVLAGRLEDVALPLRLSAAVICGTIGYFDAAARRALWSDLAQRLVPGGVVVVDVMMLSRPQVVPLMKVSAAAIGQNLCEVWLEGWPVDDGTMHWKLTYRVVHGDNLVRSFCAEHEWHTFGLERVAEEAAEFGFSFEPLADALIPVALLRRP